MRMGCERQGKVMRRGLYLGGCSEGVWEFDLCVRKRARKRKREKYVICCDNRVLCDDG